MNEWRCVEHIILLRTRTELHLQNRRPTDKIGLEQQGIIAEQLGYSQCDIFERVEHFMKDYYRATRSIYQTSELLKERMALSASHQQGGPISFRDAVNARIPLSSKELDGFILEGKTLRASARNVFKKDPFVSFACSVYCNNFQQSHTRISNISYRAQSH